jgi:hypothetical protein
MTTARIFGITYAIAAMVVAVLTTILQVQPSLFFIEMLTVNGKFPLTAVFLLTALLILLPGLLIIIVINFLRRQKNVIPDTTGRTGVILHRKRALYNAAYNFKVIMDGAVCGTVGNGQSLFVELTSGRHVISIKGFESSRFEFDLKFGSVLRLETNVKEEGIKASVLIVAVESTSL